ncbi:MAG: zinc metallopeptidase, partial [Thiotrichales bacterium]|nr:zinc metallopeptidase [Thiotrichales bacterium]
MTLLLLSIVIILVIFGPQVWCSHTLKRYAAPLEQIPGTGGELAEYLVNKLNLTDVTVESTGNGQDHYDPISKTVCLGSDNYEGKSLTAVAVSAHEVGHALVLG